MRRYFQSVAQRYRTVRAAQQEADRLERLINENDWASDDASSMEEHRRLFMESEELHAKWRKEFAIAAKGGMIYYLTGIVFQTYTGVY
jgi:hypothetical protein